MELENLKVSIVTPVHNSEAYLHDCIGSVLNQSYTCWEHLLVDDCSSDSSEKIIQSFAKNDPRIRYFKLPTNMGAGIARNTAIEAATGSYIAFLDSDDAWYPEKLEKQLRFMEMHSHPFTFTAYDHIDSNGTPTGSTTAAKPKVTYKSALFKNPIGCLTAMYDVRFFGKQYMPEIRKRQDYALWLKLLKKSDAFGIPEALSVYRDSTNSISSNKFSLIKYEWQIYRKVEKLSFSKSLFYTCSAIILKLKNYFWK